MISSRVARSSCSAPFFLLSLREVVEFDMVTTIAFHCEPPNELELLVLILFRSPAPCNIRNFRSSNHDRDRIWIVWNCVRSEILNLSAEQASPSFKVASCRTYRYVRVTGMLSLAREGR
jgi:hypothetical protein